MQFLYLSLNQTNASSVLLCNSYIHAFAYVLLIQNYQADKRWCCVWPSDSQRNPLRCSPLATSKEASNCLPTFTKCFLSQLVGRDERGKGERGSVPYQIKEFSNHIIAVFMEPINTSAQTKLMILPEADKREREHTYARDRATELHLQDSEKSWVCAQGHGVPKKDTTAHSILWVSLWFEPAS